MHDFIFEINELEEKNAELIAKAEVPFWGTSFTSFYLFIAIKIKVNLIEVKSDAVNVSI